MKLSRFDLNLLVTFDAVFRHGSVSKAAEQLGRSQPAVSHALQRLRWLLRDSLFIKSPQGMRPTPRAEALAGRVRHLLEQFQLSLEPEKFDPERESRRFAIAVNNYAAVVFTGPVIAKCTAQAPLIRLAFRPSGTLDILPMLERGELDLAIVANEARGERFSSEVLLEDDFVAVMRRGHPAAKKPLTLKTLATFPHLGISSSGYDLTFARQSLAAANLHLEIGLEVPYLAAGSVLAQSNAIAILGRLIAQEFRRSFRVEIRELPFTSSPLRSVMLWDKRCENLPAHRWLRDSIKSTVKSI